jgi:soluble lytic murein transglycosylase
VDATVRPLSALAVTPEATAIGQERFQRAAELAGMGLKRHAVRELDAIDLAPSASPDTQFVLLEAYAAVGEYDRVFDLSGLSRPDRSTPPGHPLDRFLYPRAYWETIRGHGEPLGLDPYLVTALIRQESLFAADAVSPKGARGLMQLMPTTAARLATKAGHRAPEPYDLERPEINIGYGTIYLRELFDRYGGAVFKVLAAYNAGEKAVGKWEQRFSGAEPDEFVERISYRETREYVKAVLANYRLYCMLYGGPASASNGSRSPATATTASP